MTFMIYIKFINEEHLYCLFILSWSALKVIIIVFSFDVTSNKRVPYKIIAITIRAIARAREITRVIGHSRGLFLTKRPANQCNLDPILK